MRDSVTHRVLNEDYIKSAIIVDGSSNPVLDLSMFYGTIQKAYVLLNKRQVEDLIKDLQKRLLQL